jgi:peptidoglycan/xylan/chitin deacetylase (PgdA/CDA1 family)
MEHLAALKDLDWDTGFVSEIPSESPSDQRKTAYLTFDDAFESFGDVVAPSMDTYDARATVFVPTAYLGVRARWPWGGESAELNVMSIQALGDLDPARIEVGSHGHQHLQSDLLSRSMLRSEFRLSRDILQQGLGRPVTSMAYPFGYHDRGTRRIAKEAGYHRACEVGLGLHALGKGRDLCIRRLLITPEVTPERLLRLMVEGQRATWQWALYSAGRPIWREVRRIRGALHRGESTVDRDGAGESS